MGQSSVKNPRKIFSQIGGGTDPAVLSRITYLENNVYKITYFESVNAASGQITKPTNSTIQLDQFAGGVDAYVSTIQNGQPTGVFPQTAGGTFVDVATFDALGNYTLTGTPSAFPVAIIYILTIKAVDYQNLTAANILDLEDINAVQRVNSTDNAIARYDGTSGQIQDSVVTISDSGAVVFPPLATQAYQAGLLQYDNVNESLSFYNNESDIFMQIGQEVWMRCRNVSGSTIANKSAVYVNGTDSGFPTIALAQANLASTTVCAGLATHDIENNTTGYVTVLGTVRGIDTSTLSVGNVFLSASVAGGLTNTAPTSPNYRYRVGFVTVVNATTGMIQVTPTTAALGNGTVDQLLGINPSGSQEFVNKPYDISAFRKIGTTTFERWYTQAINCSGLSTLSLGQGSLRCCPFVISKLTTIDRIAMEITAIGSVGSLVFFGVYNSTTDNMPNVRVLNAGTILGDSATFQAVTVNYQFVPGLYWFSMNHNSGTNITFRSVSLGSSPPALGITGGGGVSSMGAYYTVASVANPIPDPSPTMTTVVTTMPPAFFIRVSA
jgi:hypothetical protein